MPSQPLNSTHNNLSVDVCPTIFDTTFNNAEVSCIAHPSTVNTGIDASLQNNVTSEEDDNTCTKSEVSFQSNESQVEVLGNVNIETCNSRNLGNRLHGQFLTTDKLLRFYH